MCNLLVAYTAEMDDAIVEVELDATPEDVWDALTTPDGLRPWMGDDAAVGDAPGDSIYMPDPAGGRTRRGVLDEFSPQRRLGYTWWPETNPEEATRVTITLTPHTGGTRLTVVESIPAQPAASLSASACASWQWRSAMLGVASVAVRPLSYLRA